MKNAILIAQEFQKLLPVEQNPMYTEGYEASSIWMLYAAMWRKLLRTILSVIITDSCFEQKKELFLSCDGFLNRK